MLRRTIIGQLNVLSRRSCMLFRFFNINWNTRVPLHTLTPHFPVVHHCALQTKSKTMMNAILYDSTRPQISRLDTLLTLRAQALSANKNKLLREAYRYQYLLEETHARHCCVPWV